MIAHMSVEKRLTLELVRSRQGELDDAVRFLDEAIGRAEDEGASAAAIREARAKGVRTP